MVEHGSGRDMARRRGNRAQTAHGAVAAAMPDDPISVSIVGSDSAARWLFLAQGLGDLLPVNLVKRVVHNLGVAARLTGVLLFVLVQVGSGPDDGTDP